jgi:glycosyltransferase involved in cell wall biosynthesis
VPELKELEDKIVSRSELDINEKDFILIIQGSGLNKDRGIEEAIMALEHCKDCVLLLVGNGDVIPFAKSMVLERQMQSKVKFIPRMPYKELMRITRCADLGLLLDKNTSLNQELALPNKLFDYIHAGIPILSSDLKEITKIITKYDIGSFIKGNHPKEIAEAINAYKSDKTRQLRHRSNCLVAAKAENWQKEKERLVAVILSSEQE